MFSISSTLLCHCVPSSARMESPVGVGLDAAMFAARANLGKVSFQPINRFTAGRELLQVFGKVPDGIGVGLVLQFGRATMFK